MIQKFEVWLEVLGSVIPDNAVEQANMARVLFQELGFLPESEESKKGGCRFAGVDRVGSQLRVMLENELWFGSSNEPFVVKTEAMLAFLCPGLRIDPKILKTGYPVDLRRLPVEPHSVDDLRYYVTELLAERAKVRASRGQHSDFRLVNVLSRGMRGVEYRVGTNLGPIARTRP